MTELKTTGLPEELKLTNRDSLSDERKALIRCANGESTLRDLFNAVDESTATEGQ